jgi:hypothetical protein
MKIAKYNEYVKYLKENLNDTPETYISSLLQKLKKKIESFFVSSKDDDVEKMSQIDNKERKEKGGMSFKDLNVNLDSCEISKYSKIQDNLKVIFSDEGCRYDLVIVIELKDAIPKNNDDDFSINDIENCSIKFKKYNSETFDLEGQLMKTVKIKDIDEELLIDLKIELDDLYDTESEEGLEIETEDEPEETSSQNEDELKTESGE